MKQKIKDGLENLEAQLVSTFLEVGSLLRVLNFKLQDGNADGGTASEADVTKAKEVVEEAKEVLK